jgi:hypothetical protein
VAVIDGMKLCSGCKASHPIFWFSKYSRSSDGLAAWCKTCNLNAQKKYYNANKEKIAARRSKYGKENREKLGIAEKIYRKANPDKVAQWEATKYLRHKEKIIKATVEWGRRNKDKRKATCDKWDAANIDKKRAYVRTRQAKKRKAFPVWADESAIKEIYKQARQMELETGEKFHVDHIVPLQSPLVCGLHWEGNLQILPAYDNFQKHNRFWPGMPESAKEICYG